MAGILQRYKTVYGLTDDYPIVSLNEGNTPLIPCEHISAHIEKTTGVTGLKIFARNP